MRTPEKETELTAYDNNKIFKLDVTKPAEVAAAVDDAIAAFGKIDVVVNDAGMGSYRTGRSSWPRRLPSIGSLP